MAPSLSFLSSNSTGTRVPRITGLPSITFGFTSMRSVAGTDFEAPFQRQAQNSHRRMTMSLACANEMIHGLVSLSSATSGQSISQKWFTGYAAPTQPTVLDVGLKDNVM